MNKIDYWELDGHALRLLLAILEEGSITAAAVRLDLTQSAVSHGLTRLRRILKDPLFVKSGRGIVATAHAHAIAEPARDLLRKMKDFTSGAAFEPREARLALTIAANDFQCNLLLPALFRRLEASVARIAIRVVPSQAPDLGLVRAETCDLLITPRPPAGSDIMQRKLLQDVYVCFYDATVRRAPRKAQDYLSARHITVVHPDSGQLNFDRSLEARGIRRDIAIAVPSFSSVPEFLRGSAMLASLPRLLATHVLRDFGHAAIPLEAIAAASFRDLPMYMVWHRRYQSDPAHVWLRGLLEEVATQRAGRR